MKNEYVEHRSAAKVFLDAFRILSLREGHWFGWLISLVLALVVTFITSMQCNMIPNLEGMASTLLRIQIPMFCCTLAIYVAFVITMSDNFMQQLDKVQYGKVSGLRKFLMYYESASCLIFLGIALTGFALICCHAMTSNISDPCITYGITGNPFVDVAICLLYLLFSFRVCYEFKSIVYNTIVIMRGKIAYHFLDIKKMDTPANEK